MTWKRADARGDELIISYFRYPNYGLVGHDERLGASLASRELDMRMVSWVEGRGSLGGRYVDRQVGAEGTGYAGSWGLGIRGWAFVGCSEQASSLGGEWGGLWLEGQVIWRRGGKMLGVK